MTPRPRAGAKVLAPGDRARAPASESASRIQSLDHDELQSWSLSQLEDGLAELKANEALRQVLILTVSGFIHRPLCTHFTV